MNLLPKILIIDDDFGHDPAKQDEICQALSLRHPRQKAVASEPQYLGQAVFERGQDITSGIRRNDIDQVMEKIESGWPKGADGERWALICIDLSFKEGEVGSEHGSSPFGAEIVEAIRKRWGDRPGDRTPAGTVLPIVMLSSQDMDEVADSVDGSSVPCLEKRFKSAAGEMRTKFARALFSYGLVADGSLRMPVSPHAVNLVDRRHVLLSGQSLAMLRALQRARFLLTSRKPPNILVSGPSHSENEDLAHYMHDHRRVARSIFNYSSPEGKDVEILRAKAGTPGDKSLTGAGTVFLERLEELPPSDHRALRDLADDKKRRCVLVASIDPADADKQKLEDLPEKLRKAFGVLPWPSLSDRGRDRSILFAELLKSALKAENLARPIDPKAAQYIDKNVHELGQVRTLVEEIVPVMRDRPRVLEQDVALALRNIANRKDTGDEVTFDELLDILHRVKFTDDDLDRSWRKFRDAVAPLIQAMFTAGRDKWVTEKGTRLYGLKTWGDEIGAPQWDQTTPGKNIGRLIDYLSDAFELTREVRDLVGKTEETGSGGKTRKSAKANDTDS